MSNYTIGEVLRDLRERQKYSQEEVSYGICTPSTLSRIENGLQIPGKKILEGLMQRLGMGGGMGVAYQNREEMERHQLERRLTRSLGRGDFAEVKRLIRLIEENIQKAVRKDYGLKMVEQYVRFARIMVKKREGEAPEQVLWMLMEVIRMTIPDFDGIHLQDRLLTFHEISILDNIGCAYHDKGDLWSGVRLLFELKEYREGHALGGEGLSVKYPVILQNLSSWMEQEKRFEDALHLCQAGIDYCIEHGRLHVFPMLIRNKACALAGMGQYDLARQCFRQSIAMLQAMNQQERAEEMKKYAEVNYGIS